MKILLASHGHFASGLASSIKVLFSYIPENLEYFDAYTEEGGDLEEVINEFLERNKKETKLLISDVYGGSVCQKMVKYLNYENTYVLTGANLGLLMSLLTYGEEINKEVINNILNETKQFVCLIDESELQSSDDEDIF